MTREYSPRIAQRFRNFGHTHRLVAGIAGLSIAGVVVPGKTPRPIITRLHTEIVKALNAPDLRAKLAAESSEVGGMPPEAFAQYIRNEIAKWRKVVKDANIKVEWCRNRK